MKLAQYKIIHMYCVGQASVPFAFERFLFENVEALQAPRGVDRSYFIVVSTDLSTARLGCYGSKILRIAYWPHVCIVLKQEHIEM